MEDILSQEQSSSRDQEQVYYARNKMPSCRIDDLIMISNSQGSYLFVNYNRDEDESPVFKIRNSRVDYGQLQLQLVVMEVIYPIPLYHHESERANILHAIRDGLAVVKETNHIITFSVGRMHHIEEVDLNIIDCVQPIKVKSPIYVKGDCESGICGEVKVERRPRITYKYFLSLKPKSGCVELNNRTGSWRYEGRCDEVENDFFEITVWDGLGGYATQRIYIKCEQEEKPIGVNVLNVPLPIVAASPLPIWGDVRVINTPSVSVVSLPEVTIASLPPVEVSGLVSVTVPEVVTVTVGQPIDVNVLTLPEVAIASLPAVEVSGLVSVTVPDVLTVTVEQPIDVNVLTLPEVAIASLPAVEISGLVSVTVPDVLTVTAEQPIDVNVLTLPEVTIASLPAVEISGTPTVLINSTNVLTVTIPEVVEVCIVNTDLSVVVATVIVDPLIDANVISLPEVTIASLPAVEVSGLVSVTVPDVLTVTAEQPIDVNVLTLPEVALASLPAVEVSGLVSVTVPDVLTVTAEQPIDVNVLTLPEVAIASLPAVEVSGLVSVTVPDVLTVTAEQPIEVNVLTLPEVAIASLPAVEVSGLVSVTVPEVITVTVEQPIDVVVITTITTVADLNAYNYYETPLTSLYVPVAASAAVIYDISRSIDQTIFTHLASGDSVIAQIIISPTSNPDYFYPAGITQELSVTSPNYPFVSNYFGRYLGVSFSNDTVTPATVEVIAQSQGPIIES